MVPITALQLIYLAKNTKPDVLRYQQPDHGKIGSSARRVGCPWLTADRYVQIQFPGDEVGDGAEGIM